MPRPVSASGPSRRFEAFARIHLADQLVDVFRRNRLDEINFIPRFLGPFDRTRQGGPSRRNLGIARAASGHRAFVSIPPPPGSKEQTAYGKHSTNQTPASRTPVPPEVPGPFKNQRLLHQPAIPYNCRDAAPSSTPRHPPCWARKPGGRVPMVSPQESDPGRLRSVDAYRGFVMLAMASGGIATFECLSRTGQRRVSIPSRGPPSAVRPRPLARRRFLGPIYRRSCSWSACPCLCPIAAGREPRRSMDTTLRSRASFVRSSSWLSASSSHQTAAEHTNFTFTNVLRRSASDTLSFSWCSDSDRVFNSPSLS